MNQDTAIQNQSTHNVENIDPVMASAQNKQSQ